MDMVEKQKMIGELKIFLKELKSYKRRLDSDKQASEAEKRYTDSLRGKLVRKSGKLKGIVIQLTGKHFYTRFERIHDFWAGGLDFGYRDDLGFCINATNEAIGKLESTPLAELALLEVSVTQPPKDTAESPVYLFDKMQFHPKIVNASRALFEDAHYAQAIFEAFKAVENFVREKSGLSSYGKNLMATAFNEENPIIKVPEAGYFDKDVQEGFKFLFMGATQGIRNPKAHKEIVQNDPFITLEYLGFASFLLKRIGYWEADIS